jgi:alkylhydroperoxidase family enzyme
VDAHSAMVMAQGFTREQVKSVLDDVDGSDLIDVKTKSLLHLAEKINRQADKVTEDDMAALKQAGCSEDDIFEAVAVTALFNYMDRMADALGAPVEGFQEMMAQMTAE